nr:MULTISPECIES: hypothetical protein [Flavobacterium]
MYFGVELGKQLANSILEELNTGNLNTHDSSTNFLLKEYISQ